MASRSRVRLGIGSRAKVCMDNNSDILEDMGICGPDGVPLKNTWMHGTVVAKSANYFTIKLPAAEETMDFPKEKVIATNKDEDPPPAYVLFPTKVKKVFGLQLPENKWPEDYYADFAEARRQFIKSVQNAKKRTVKKASSAVKKGK